MHKVLAIAGDDLAGGLALAGIDVQKVPDASAARDALVGAMESGDYGIVIVEERLASQFDAKTETMIDECNVPLIVSAPAEMKWRDVEQAPQDDYVASLIRRAVGYQLNIQD